MAEVYANLDDLKLVMGSSWDDTQETLAERLLEVASAGLRSIFKRHSMNLDELLVEGDLEEILVNQVVCDIVARGLASSTAPLGGDFSQLSQAAGGYSISISSSGQGLYLKKEQAKWLGLPSITTSKINFWGVYA